jgi:hypothetical protein
MTMPEVQMTSMASSTSEQDGLNGASCNVDDKETVPVTIEYGEEEDSTVVNFSFKRLLMFAGTPRPVLVLVARTRVICEPAARRLPTDGSLLVFVDAFYLLPSVLQRVGCATRCRMASVQLANRNHELPPRMTPNTNSTQAHWHEHI